MPTATQENHPLDRTGRHINLLALGSEVGLLIAIPLVVLVLIGIKLDKTLNTLPLFIILAILIAPFLSGAAIWRKIKNLTHE